MKPVDSKANRILKKWGKKNPSRNKRNCFAKEVDAIDSVSAKSIKKQTNDQTTATSGKED